MKTIVVALFFASSLAGYCGDKTTPPAPKPPELALPPTTAPQATPSLNIEVRKNGSKTLSASTGGYYRATSAADLIPPLVIQFSSTNQLAVQEWEEDLAVMTRLLEESVQRAADEDLGVYKMGIKMLVTASRSVRPLYLEGFGALFMVKVNFPVMPPTKVEEEKVERTESEWEKARQELYGRRQASWMGGTVESGVDYDADQVDTLKKELIESLKNATNFRHLRPDEYVSITVFGSPNSGAKTKATAKRKKAPGDANANSTTANKEAATREVDRAVRDLSRSRPLRTGTVLTLRVKKSDVDAYASGDINYEAFEKKVALNTYLGSGYGITSLNSWIQSTIREYGISP